MSILRDHINYFIKSNKQNALGRAGDFGGSLPDTRKINQLYGTTFGCWAYAGNLKPQRSGSMISFDSLPMEKQRQSLTRLGRTVMLHYGLGNSKIKFHSYSENIVLRVDSKKSVKGCHIFSLRIYNLSFTEAEIEASTKWMQTLCQHTEVTAPEPIPTRSGQLIVRETMPDTNEQRLCVLFQWLDGECIDEEMKPLHLRKVGQMTARMHGFSASQGRASANGLPKMEWNARLAAIGGGNGLMPHWVDQPDTFFTKEESRIIDRTAQKALAAIQSFDKGNEYGVIHGDLHQWNYMFHQEEVRVFDFDDSCFSSFVYDMAVTLWYLNHFVSFHRDYQEKVDAYLEGYQEIRGVPSGFDEQLGAYTIARHMQMMCWVLGWPRSDHIVPAQPFLRNTVQVFNAYLNG